MKRFICILLMLLVSAFMIIGNVSAVELVVFGPEQYERTRGKPNLYIDDFQCSPSIGKLIIKNGDENGKNRIADAEIEINGSLLLGSDHFNPRVYVIELPVDLDEDNSISVKLASKPGSFLTVQIVQVQEVVQSTLPDTGQTKCYDNQLELTTCPGEEEPFYGQDANYVINPQSYTKLDEDGNELDDIATDWVMVRDNVSGLIWECKTDDDGIHDKDNIYTWYEAQNTFINQLNNDNFGGFSDWRMPTVKELSFIRNMGRYNPAINRDYFPNAKSSGYWSSTTASHLTDYAWGVIFYYGFVYSHHKSNSYYVRAVRSGQ